MFPLISAVMRKELRSYFSSYIAYVVIAMFLVLAGWFFYVPVVFYGEGTLEYSYSNTLIVLLFLMPLITMRQISEERKSGSLELLFTRPIGELHVVLGKFFAAAILWLVMMLPTLFYASIVFQFAEPKPDILPMISQFLSVYLVGLSFISVGLFASSLTENQVVAAFLSFTFILILWLLNWLSSLFGTDSIISYFAISNYIDDLLKGVVDARDIAFYLSFMAFWLYATVMSLYSRRLG